ncbi:MAG TPA: PE-PPE domain-containing protein, partial [Mycobacterium sp.]
MRTGMRKAAVTCGSVFASVLLALSTATSAWGSSSALVIGGIATPTMHDLVMAQLLGGALQGQERVSVNWPAQAAPYTGADDLTLGASINVGITNLNAQIDAALDRLARDENGNVVDGEKVTVVGLSAGSLVVNEVLRQLAADTEAPDSEDITFIVVADSSRQKLIDEARYNSKHDYTYRPAPETKYDIIVVTGEYDGLADFPDRWWNLLAVANAIAGSVYVHIPVMFADLSKVPAENITVDVNSQGGTTSHYLVPTTKLPLVQMFPSLAWQEAELKAAIDKGYSRNDVPAGALQTLVTAVPDLAVANDTSAVEQTQQAEVLDEADATQEVAAPVEVSGDEAGATDTRADAVMDGAEIIADGGDSVAIPAKDEDEAVVEDETAAKDEDEAVVEDGVDVGDATASESTEPEQVEAGDPEDVDSPISLS